MEKVFFYSIAVCVTVLFGSASIGLIRDAVKGSPFGDETNDVLLSVYGLALSAMAIIGIVFVWYLVLTERIP